MAACGLLKHANDLAQLFQIWLSRIDIEQIFGNTSIPDCHTQYKVTMELFAQASQEQCNYFDVAEPAIAFVADLGKRDVETQIPQRQITLTKALGRVSLIDHYGSSAHPLSFVNKINQTSHHRRSNFFKV